jgi:succinate dehydrogenase flavin-adding protein (antitoxin of CptAB toxin-antitoxin module)
MTEREGNPVAGWAERLERLARLVPGVGAYQDREGMREADKQVRAYLADQLHGLMRELEPAERRLADIGRTERLPSLDRIARQLATLADRIRHASYGFAGVFAGRKVREPELAALHGFDVRLAESLPALRSRLREVADAAYHGEDFAEVLHTAEEAVRAFEQLLDSRDVLAKGL